jgi:hypothetical protein
VRSPADDAAFFNRHGLVFNPSFSRRAADSDFVGPPSAAAFPQKSAVSCCQRSRPFFNRCKVAARSCRERLNNAFPLPFAQTIPLDRLSSRSNTRLHHPIAAPPFAPPCRAFRAQSLGHIDFSNYLFAASGADFGAKMERIWK